MDVLISSTKKSAAKVEPEIIRKSTLSQKKIKIRHFHSTQIKKTRLTAIELRKSKMQNTLHNTKNDETAHPTFHS